MLTVTLQELLERENSQLRYALMNSASPKIAELFSTAGFDFIMFDLEHGSDSPDDLIPCLEVISRNGVPVAAKTRSQKFEDIRNAVDLGFHAIEVPGISSASEIAAARQNLDRCIEDLRQKGESHEVALIALVESVEGMRNLHEIAANPGISAVDIGQSDLAKDLGIEGQFGHPLIVDAFASALEVAESYNVCVGIGGPGATVQQWAEWARKGNRLEFVLSDLGALKSAATHALGPYAGRSR